MMVVVLVARTCRVLGHLAQRRRPHTQQRLPGPQRPEAGCAGGEPGPVVMKPGLSKDLPRCSSFHGGRYYPEDKADHTPQLLRVTRGIPLAQIFKLFLMK